MVAPLLNGWGSDAELESKREFARTVAIALSQACQVGAEVSALIGRLDEIGKGLSAGNAPDVMAAGVVEVLAGLAAENAARVAISVGKICGVLHVKCGYDPRTMSMESLSHAVQSAITQERT